MDGSEISDIIIYLNSKGIKSPKGIDYWDPNTIKAMLKNEKYIGDYEYQRKYTVDTMTGKRRMNRGQVPKYYIEDHHIPIIEKHIYESVQIRIKENRREPVPDARKAGTAGRESYYQKFYCGECGALISRYKSSIYDSRVGSQWRCNHSYRVVTSNCSAKMFMEKYMDYNFVKALEDIKKSKKFRALIRKSLSNLELSPSELEDKEMIEEQIEKLNHQLYTAVDMEVQKNGKDTNLINDITEKIIKLRERQLVYIDRIEKLEDEQERFRNLMKYCENIQPISFRKFHNMRPRIQQGESLYLKSNAAKNSTYMDLDGMDHFPEEVFVEYVLSGSINLEGRIKFKFAEDIEFGIDMTYEDYQRRFEEEKSKIQWEEFMHSEEIIKLKEFCKIPRKPIEIKNHLGISSNISYEKRFRVPLLKAGLIELIDSKCNRDRKYKWVDSNDEV
ncbi:MAG: recombinase family protein [Clostridiales bacterium]|nr:recombinase family protein [Clostridiales bacterium]